MKSDSWDFTLVRFPCLMRGYAQYGDWPLHEATDFNGANVAVIGVNGSGKTEVLRHLAFALNPNALQYPPQGIDVASSGVLLSQDATRAYDQSIAHIFEGPVGIGWCAPNDLYPIGSDLGDCHEKFAGRVQGGWLGWNALREEFRQQSRLLLLHQENVKRLRERSTDNPVSVRHLMALAVPLTEDAPESRAALAEIRQVIGRVFEAWDASEFEGNEYDFAQALNKFADRRGLTSVPLYTSWLLGYAQWWPRYLHGFSEVPPETDSAALLAISWPFHTPFRDEALAVKADSSLFQAAPKIEPAAKSTARQTSRDIAELLVEWGLGQPYQLPDGEFIPFESFANVSDGLFVQEMAAAHGETLSVWGQRAHHALKLAKSGKPLKVIIWDEPERGLHPSAVESVRDRVFPWLKQRGIKAIYATHSLVLADQATSVVTVHRHRGMPKATALTQPSVAQLERAGFTRHDVLLSQTRTVFVEGVHDEIVMNTVFSNVLDSGRTKIRTLAGNKSAWILDAEVFLELNTEIIVVVDGGRASEAGTDRIAGINSALAKSDHETLLRLLKQWQTSLLSSSRDEGKNLSAFLQVVLKRAAALSPHRFRIFMLDKNDITLYLDPAALYGDDVAFKSWGAVREARNRDQGKPHRYDKRGDKLRPTASTKKVSSTLQEKNYLTHMYGLKIDPSRLKSAASQLLDRPLPPDWERLAEHLQTKPQL